MFVHLARSLGDVAVLRVEEAPHVLKNHEVDTLQPRLSNDLPFDRLQDWKGQLES